MLSALPSFLQVFVLILEKACGETREVCFEGPPASLRSVKAQLAEMDRMSCNGSKPFADEERKAYKVRTSERPMEQNGGYLWRASDLPEVYVYACIYIHIYICMYLSVHVFIYTQMYAHIHIEKCTCMCICICICMCIYIHIHIA